MNAAAGSSSLDIAAEFVDMQAAAAGSEILCSIQVVEANAAAAGGQVGAAVDRYIQGERNAQCLVPVDIPFFRFCDGRHPTVRYAYFELIFVCQFFSNFFFGIRIS